jgi:hypothetical protein
MNNRWKNAVRCVIDSVWPMLEEVERPPLALPEKGTLPTEEVTRAVEEFETREEARSRLVEEKSRAESVHDISWPFEQDNRWKGYGAER